LQSGLRSQLRREGSPVSRIIMRCTIWQRTPVAFSGFDAASP
jgi:hypothetical protein